MSYQHVLKDVQSRKSAVFPAATAAADIGVIDLGTVRAGPGGTRIYYELPALPNFTGGSLTVSVKDSADNSSFSTLAVAGLSWTLAGVASTGTEKQNLILVIPPAARRYLKVNVAVAASGGDNTASTFECGLCTQP